MIHVRQSLPALCLLLLPLVTLGQGSEAPEANSLDTIFEAIPFEGQMSETVNDLHTQFSQNPFGLPPSQNQKMMDQFLESFAADQLVADAREAFQQNSSSGYADTTRQWLQQETIQPILEAEKEFYTIQGLRNRIINQYELEQDPPSETRLQLISSLAQNKTAVETEVESQIIIFRSLVTAFSALSPQQNFSESQIDGIVENFQSQSSSQIQQEVNNQLLLMYHGIEAKRLEDYLQFYDTGAGSWFRDTKAQSMHTAYQAAGDRFMKALEN